MASSEEPPKESSLSVTRSLKNTKYVRSDSEDYDSDNERGSFPASTRKRKMKNGKNDDFNDESSTDSEPGELKISFYNLM